MSLLEQVLGDEELAAQEEADREVESAARHGKTRVVFFTQRGALDLRELRPDEVRALHSGGKMTDEELREWADRRNVLRIPRQKMTRLRERRKERD